MNWQPIETAPTDGSIVRVKRVHEGDLVAEGDALFGFLAADAPANKPLPPDPLGRDNSVYDAIQRDWASRAHWLRPDRMYAFPQPTHWDADVPARR